MASLTKKKTGELRRELVQQRATLLGQTTQLESDERVLTEARMSFEERARNEGEGDQLAVERDLIAKLGTQARQSLAEVDAALARIDAGTYGVCTSCEVAIPVERLEARPASSSCVPCASPRR